MRSIQWISDNGLYITFSETAPYILTSVLRSGVGAVAQVFKAPFQDGATSYNAALEQRTINFEFCLEAIGNKTLKAKTVLDEQSNFLNELFLPKTWGWLIYTNERGGNIIRARPVTTPTIKNELPYNIFYDVELLTDSPYWQDSELKTLKLGDTEKLWSFPFTFPVTFGQSTQYATVNIKSKYDVYPVFEISSQLSTLKITNTTTGEHIDVTQAIAENQYMRIDTYEKTVELYEDGVFKEDVSNWADGDFIKLVHGNNVLKVENNVSGEVPAAFVYWREPIMGV